MIKKKLLLCAATVVALGLAPVYAQLGMGGGGPGPQLDGAINKLFGDNKSFNATMEIQTSTGNGGSVDMPGKFTYDSGKSRFELNIADVKGSVMPPEAVQRMKAMGMDQTVAIARPDLKLMYLVYPGLNSYAQMPIQDNSGSASPDDFTVTSTAAGKETVDGHDCTKNNVTVTGKDSNKHEFTVWNASDLKNFPVKIETDAGGRSVTMSYKDISMTKPNASLFDPPSGYTKYDNVQTMMQTEMMKRMPPSAPPGQQ